MDLSLTLCYLLLRFVIPFILGSAVILRQNLFSFVYLILLFVGPILPTPNSENVLKGANGVYLKLIIVLSSIINSAHIIFQVVLLIVSADYNTSFEYCSLVGKIYNLIGFQRYNGVSVLNILRLCCLDFIILILTCMIYAFCIRSYTTKLAKDSSRENLTKNEAKRIERERRLTEAGFSVESISSQMVTKQILEKQQQLNKKKQMKEKADRLTYFLTESIFCILLFAASVFEPSLTSSVYFIYFLFIGSWFALNRHFGLGYHYFRIFIALFVAVHLSILFIYQIQIIQPILQPDNINARLFGFVDFFNQTCSDVRSFDLNSYHFVRFLHPFSLILLYFVSINLIRSVLISKKYLSNEMTTPPVVSFASFSFASDRNSNGFLSHLFHNGTNIMKRHSKTISVQLSQNLNVVKYKKGYINIDGIGNENERIVMDYATLSESIYMNLSYNNKNALSTANDLTPLLQDDRARAYPKVMPGRANIEELDSGSNQHSVVSTCTPSMPNTPNKAYNKQPSSMTSPDNQFALFFSQMVNMIKRGSYVITLIVMMTWSITYHSWLSFALLLSSCIIWMMPNSRQACLNSSPILVAYALLLVIGQYVYSLDLNDQELPIYISNVSISEIGFKKYGDRSYQPLFIKIFYTLFFWITLRQYTESRANRIKRELGQGIFSPLYNIGYDTFNSPNNIQHTNANRQFSLSEEQDIYHSKIFDSLIRYFKELLIKYWIWVVATMLMVMSLSGSKVVIYRIVYMFLFLTFTLLFQLSLKWWRKFIYPFWLIVILYSMIILIAIYTYQFNNFPQYWQDYLYINTQLQEDLGLVVYDNDAFILFKELLTPTFFIIITIIQVHFVHRDFLEFSNFSDIPNQSHPVSSDDSQSSPKTVCSDESKMSIKASSLDQSDVKVDIDLKSQPSQSEISSIQTVISKVPRPGYTEIHKMSPEYRPNSPCSNSSLAKDSPKKNTFFSEMKAVSIKCISYIGSTLDKLMTIFWRILEVHILKFVFLCAIIISITDISAMNILFVFLSVFLMVFSKFENVTCFLFGLWAGILILLKMLFQLNFAQQIEWHTNCTIENDYNITTKVIDNRIYIGFLKQDDIFNYTKEYIMLIVILVFRSVIMLRQHVYRHLEYGTRPLFQGIVFPKITRISADKDFSNFLKYIVNFGFYKFGVEICLIFLTISIAKRGDIFSVFYCIWILLFVLLNRQGNHKMWPYFVGFLAIVLPYQYLMCLGIPPGLCVLYPWSNFVTRPEREWYFLPDFEYQLPKDKLYLDFAVLFFACRQLICFRLESSLTAIAGSNLEAHKEEVGQNVPDFFSFGNSIFDSIKSFFFFCFFWLTLAVLFLTGTTRINLFGLGYVLGSFIFLWNGNEFYLKPIKLIFKLWKLIIAFTCITMLLKSIIQLFVIAMLKNNLCWLIQLLGISYYEKADTNVDNLMQKCHTDEAGLLWDGICFTFLLIQKRIFCSNYFKHLVREIKAQHFLASRGAELIHEIQAKEVAEQELAEKEVMEKIKQKMDRIKAAQQKMFADKAKSIKYHKQAVKSGGYYMFEDLDSDVVDLNYNTRESLIPDPEGNEIRNLAKSKGFTTFCSKIFKGEQDAALVSSETTDIGESSKDSPIVSVERPKYHPDMSKPTTMTSIVSTSQATDISNMSSLVSHPVGTSRKDSIVKTDLPCITNEETEEKEESEKSQTYMEKISNWFNFIKGFFASIFISATSSLNSVSRDYRFVAKRLSIEKKCLKKVIEIEESHGNIHDFISDQNWRKSALMKLSCVTEDTLENIVKSEPELAMLQWNELIKEREKGDKDLYYGTLDPKFMEISIYIHFFRAIFYAILSRSEVICYITIVINQITSASILSLPLPLFAFLWGSLSVPRPSKSFWVTSITYIEVMVVIKYVFQFQFWPWLDEIDLSPFWWPRLIGIEQKDNYANFDLLLLLVLFFHRFMLKGLGLWDLSETEVKAYMTNAELIQNEIENKESSSDNGKRDKVSKKEKKSTKGKLKMEKSVELGDNHPGKTNLNDCQDLSVHQTNQPIYAVITEDNLFDFDDDDGDSNTEFNAIYFMMKVPNKAKQRIKSTIKPIIKFFHNVLHPPYRITRDVYSLMFLCDFINFFILVFGFYAFGSGYSGTDDVAIFLEENKIPIGFLFTLLIQFAQIIIDRAIYLRKYIKGKLIFQIISVIFTHMWLFFVLPAITDKEFTHKTNLPPKMWYIFKCIYFLLSAYQIRSGYPTRILGNTFCKKYNFVNWYLFKIYMLIPFVYDLRMYMDWIWTDTSLVLDEWSLMEDIFVNLYQRKCELKLDEEFPEPRGKAKKRFFKYLIGGSWVAIIIALIWGPLGLFAFGRAVGEVNPPIGATIELEIGGFQPLFKMSVTGSGLEPIDDTKWNKLKENFNKNAIAQSFISGYDQRDVYVVNLNGNSTAVWGISPPSQNILQQELLNNQTLSMKITYYIMRKKQTKTQDMDTSIYDEHPIKLDPVRDIVIRKQLAAMISYTDEEQIPAIIPNIFPNYLRVPEKGKPTVVKDLLRPEWNKTYNYRNIQILLKKGNYENGSLSSWWEIHDNCDHVDYLDNFFQYILQSEKCQYLPIILFNDKVFIGLLAFLSGYGIIGIYTTFVFLVSRWVRGLNSESSFKVIYTRMPNVDRVLQLCLDIYLVRESREFELEEDLYAKLIFLYRSPETLIKWTKTNEELSPTPKKTIVVTKR